MKRFFLLLIIGLLINAYFVVAQDATIAVTSKQTTKFKQLKSGETYLINIKGSTCTHLFAQQMIIKKKGNIYQAKYIYLTTGWGEKSKAKILESKNKQLTNEDIEAIIL